MVFVLDRHKKPLMPCSEKRASFLMKFGRARVHRMAPFTIRLVDRKAELREYLLEKWGRKCAYCGAENVPLEIEHIVPKSRGGSNRASNLTLACVRCNREKGNATADEYLAKRPAVLARITARAQASLEDAAAANRTRKALHSVLRVLGLPCLGIPKAHSLDAACVGAVENVLGLDRLVLAIRSMGRGAYKRTRLTKYGFPRGYLMRTKKVRGFQARGIVRASVPSGKFQCEHTGRVAVRASGHFDITTVLGKVSASFRHCRLLQRADGYLYVLKTLKETIGGRVSSPASMPEFQRGKF